MNLQAETSLRGTVRALWSRAPLWRFAFMSASLLTLLFVLFPPEPRHLSTDVAQTAEPPSYKPQIAMRPVPRGAPPVEIAAAPQNPAPQPMPQPTSPPVQEPAPQIAKLSLAGVAPNNDPRQMRTGLDEAMTGPLYSNIVQANGFKIPLPPGDWMVLARARVVFQASSGMGYVLGKVEHKTLVGATIIWALKPQPPDKIGADWPIVKNSGCERTNILFMAKEDPTEDGLTSCWFEVNYFTGSWRQWADRGTQMSGLMRIAAGDLTAKGISYPQDLIGDRFVRLTKDKLLYIDYLFNPEPEGITESVAISSSDSDWAPANISHFPEKAAYAQRIQYWGADLLPHIQDVFASGE